MTKQPPERVSFTARIPTGHDHRDDADVGAFGACRRDVRGRGEGFSRKALLLAALAVGGMAPMADPADLGAQEGREVQVASGLAVSFAPDHDGWGRGLGILLQYAFAPAGWGGGRLYAGGVLTGARGESCPAAVDPCALSSRIGVAGAKVRFLAPVPYVGPFFEVGVGGSVGSIESRVGPFGLLGALEEEHTGLMFHVPFAIGLAIGSRHQHELSFAYFAHPGREHIAGSIQAGIAFTIG